MIDNAVFDAQNLGAFWQFFKKNEGFDPESFLQLVEDTGEDTTLKIIARFTETLKETESYVRQGLASDDPEAIWRAAHKISGSANLIGFTQCGDLARDLSHQIKANPDLSNYSAEIDIFLKIIQSLISQINVNITNLKAHL
jgi:HPt (histidine-containing phosphotransfer) domain-containing protein